MVMVKLLQAVWYFIFCMHFFVFVTQSVGHHQQKINNLISSLSRTYTRDHFKRLIHWIPLATSNLIHKRVLIKYGTHHIQTFHTLMLIRSLLFGEHNLHVIAGCSQ